MQLTKDQICKLFNCSLSQLNNQYLDNAEALSKMHMQAKATGKKVNGYTESELYDYTNKYQKLSK